MNLRDAEAVLEGAELVPAIRTTLPHAKELLSECLAAEIPAILGRDDSCASGTCAPQVQIFIRAEDTPRLARLLEDQWQALAAREGTAVTFETVEPGAGEDEPPCPACGTRAALVEGACSDCGLQLE